MERVLEVSSNKKINDLIEKSSEKSSESSIIKSSKSEENKSSDNNIINNNIDNSKVKKLENSISEKESNKNEKSDLIENNENNENKEELSLKEKEKEKDKSNENDNALVSFKSSKDSNKFINNEITISSRSSDLKDTQQNTKNANSINKLFNFNINNKTLPKNIFINKIQPPKKPKEYAYLKNIPINQKFLIDMKINDKNKNNNNQSNKKEELNQHSEEKSLDSDMFNQLKNLSLSLDNEKAFSNFFNKINKDNSSVNTYKEKNIIAVNNNKNINSRSKRSTKYSQEMTSGSTNSNLENFNYPDVFYINEENNLHTKTHISMLFTKLKNRNNNSN